ncbi:MAG: glutathione S-transferase [Sphingobium sp.]|uniref:glutathione S-transferase n=1 Tax=Sphingobium sp. TaxID=1912891 RepID=UPI0029B88761|nr:glutathione S-transferase [Sphingobium sp.]MDX3909820.1 glutathione S-transferase [Sphingobium sp.]
MPYPVLYSFRRCPYAMRARMALLVSGTPCELREVKLSKKPDAMIAASPKGTVPVLVQTSGAVLDESIDIMQWALRRNDPEGWLQGDAATIIATNDGPFKHHLDRYKYPSRHGSDPKEHREAGATILAGLEERLQSGSNLMREQRSLADMAVMPFVRQFAETDRSFFDGLPLPQVQHWLDRHLQSALFRNAMLRVDPWQPGDPPVVLVAD